MKTYFKCLTILSFLLFANGCSTESPEPMDDKKDELDAAKADLAALDKSVADFMEKYDVPGASLAISKNEKLVYRKGYGLANIANNTAVTVNSRFRLADLTETYTAVAIMQLIERGRFKMDDFVFGDEKSVLGTTYGTKAYPENFKKITVRHLLQRTAALITTESNGDPLFFRQDLDNQAFLNWMMDNSKLSSEPGTQFEFAASGYFILGRIIEKFTGKPYIDYIKTEMLIPLGDKSTELAKSSQSEALPNEVTYYGHGSLVGFEYGVNFKRRDSGIGLVATATDVLRFVNVIDGFSTRPDILNRNTLNMMLEPAPMSDVFGSGIGKFQDIWYKYGEYPGTLACFMRADSGLTVVLLLNYTKDYFDDAQSIPFAEDMLSLLAAMVRDTQRKYENIDQF